MLRYKTETRPGLVALYDIRPGNGAGPFLQPRSPHGTILPRPTLLVHHTLPLQQLKITRVKHTSAEGTGKHTVYFHVASHGNIIIMYAESEYKILCEYKLYNGLKSLEFVEYCCKYFDQ